MAGGGAVVSVAAFNFLEDSDLTKFWLRQNSGSLVHWFIGSVQLVVLSVGLLESSAVRGSIRLPRCSLRGRPGVLYDGFLASLVSSSLCLWLVVGVQQG